MPEKRYVWAVSDALHEEMARDPRVVVIGQDIRPGGSFGATRGLLEAFGEARVRDTPISEAAIVGLGGGMATMGLRPVVEVMFSDFLSLAMDQIVNQIAKLHFMFGGNVTVPITIRAAAGGGLSAGPQHSQNLEAWFAHVPGLRVVAPATPADAKGLLKSAIRDENPVLVLEHKALYAAKGEVPDGEFLTPLGETATVRMGTDATVVAYSRAVSLARKAAEKLVGDGIEVALFDLRSLNPLDLQPIITSVRETHRVVIVHEAVRQGGFGAELAALIAEQALPYLDHAPIRVGGAFSPIPFNPVLERAVLPAVSDIVQAVRASLWLEPTATEEA